MKKLILVFVAAHLSYGSFAQTDEMDKSMKQQTMDKSKKDCCMMKDGKMIMMKDGKMMAMDHDMTMSNGTKCMTDGTCIKKDGSKMMMKEGQCMDMSGNMVPMKNDKDKMYLVPDSIKDKQY